MFTRQHYKALAELVNGKTCVQILNDNANDYIHKETFVSALADFFEGDNDRFDRDKFLIACYGVPSNNVVSS